MAEAEGFGEGGVAFLAQTGGVALGVGLGGFGADVGGEGVGGLREAGGGDAGESVLGGVLEHVPRALLGEGAAGEDVFVDKVAGAKGGGLGVLPLGVLGDGEAGFAPMPSGKTRAKAR